MAQVNYFIPKISCSHCVNTIQTEVGGMSGVKSVKVNKDTKMVEIVFDAPASEEAIKALLAEIDYPVSK